jgi:outer membrane murein-binding lipoprotein Lpp
MSEQMRWILSNILAPVVVAVIIGMASAYATARLTIEQLAGRVSAVESNVERLEKEELPELKAQIKATADRERESSERLIRLESKIDLLLERAR